ncbi:MAG: chromate transporter [Dorea sp.]|nr:chromate transporter [Dorea sp.]
MNLLLQLFLSFSKIGFTSFGGLSMIPLINSEMTAHGWMTISEVADIVAIAEMTPGPLGMNCATFAGMRVAGVLGALCATMGMLAPTFTICAAAGFFFEKFKNSEVTKSIMLTVRPVCIGLIGAVIIQLSKTNYLIAGSVALPRVLLGCLAMYLLMKKKCSIPVVIALAAVAGLFIG